MTRRCLLRRLLPVLLALLASSSLDAAEVKRGDRGYGWSVFEGREPARFEVEILGRLTATFPGSDLILARVSGQGLETSGVIAGMSGSPVTVNGELIGALAYAWAYSKDAICGITPIEAMRAIPAGGGAMPGRPAVPALPPLEEILGADPAGAWQRWVGQLTPALATAAGGPTSAGLALSLGGLRPLEPGPVTSWFERQGLFAAAVAGGEARSGSPATVAVAPPKPGSAVAAMLVSGDLSISAIGTVTEVTGDRLLAFGHPFLGLGPSEIPLAEAEVVTVLPSLARSVKFGNAGREIGVLVEDRNAGVAARLGATARTIPFELNIAGEPAPLRFRIARSDFLAPMLVSMVADQSIAARGRQAGETTFRWTYTLGTPAGELRFSDLFSGFSARNRLSATLGLLYAWLSFHPAGGLTPESIRLDVAVEFGSQRGRLVRVDLPRRQVRAGESLRLRAEIQQLGSSIPVVRELLLDLPADLPPGRAQILVGDGRSLSTTELAARPADPRHAAEVPAMIARLRPADRLAAILFRRTEGAVVDGTPLPDLPPSVRTLLPAGRSSPRDGGLALFPVAEAGVDLPFELEGTVRLDLDILPPSSALPR